MKFFCRAAVGAGLALFISLLTPLFVPLAPAESLQLPLHNVAQDRHPSLSPARLRPGQFTPAPDSADALLLDDAAHSPATPHPVPLPTALPAGAALLAGLFGLRLFRRRDP